MIDDDIRSLYKNNDNTKLVKVSVKHAIEECFTHMAITESLLGGFYPVRNLMCMRDDTTYDLKYLIGSFICGINKRFQQTYKYKADFQHTIQAFQECGSIVRINRICIWSDPYFRDADLLPEENAEAVAFYQQYRQ